MAKIDEKEVRHISSLANLKNSESEIKKFSSQLSKILTHIDELSEVDTNDVIPTSQTTGLTNVFRDDRVEESLSEEEAISGTDKLHNGYFVVERVIRK